MWWMLIRYRKQMIQVVVIVAAMIMGFSAARLHYQAQLSKLKMEYAQQTVQREQQAKQRLQAALVEQQKWQKIAEQQNLMLTQERQKIDKQEAKLNKEIPHAITQDNANGTVYNGLGADSLQLYLRAFGYDTN